MRGLLLVLSTLFIGASGYLAYVLGWHIWHFAAVMLLVLIINAARRPFKSLDTLIGSVKELKDIGWNLYGVFFLLGVLAILHVLQKYTDRLIDEFDWTASWGIGSSITSLVLVATILKLYLGVRKEIPFDTLVTALPSFDPVKAKLIELTNGIKISSNYIPIIGILRKYPGIKKLYILTSDDSTKSLEFISSGIKMEDYFKNFFPHKEGSVQIRNIGGSDIFFQVDELKEKVEHYLKEWKLLKPEVSNQLLLNMTSATAPFSVAISLLALKYDLLVTYNKQTGMALGESVDAVLDPFRIDPIEFRIEKAAIQIQS